MQQILDANHADLAHHQPGSAFSDQTIDGLRIFDKRRTLADARFDLLNARVERTPAMRDERARSHA